MSEHTPANIGQDRTYRVQEERNFANPVNIRISLNHADRDAFLDILRRAKEAGRSCDFILIGARGTIKRSDSESRDNQLKIGAFATKMTHSLDTYNPSKTDTMRLRVWSQVEIIADIGEAKLIRQFLDSK